MRSISDLYRELTTLNSSIERIIQASRYSEYDDLSGLELDARDPEQRLLREELRSILDHLERASSSISYLSQPIAYSGTLHKQANGRYMLDGYELTSGNGLEALVPCEIYSEEQNDYIEGVEWVASRLEHDGNDYYLVGYRDLQLEGLTARKRERRY